MCPPGGRLDRSGDLLAAKGPPPPQRSARRRCCHYLARAPRGYGRRSPPASTVAAVALRSSSAAGSRCSRRAWAARAQGTAATSNGPRRLARRLDRRPDPSPVARSVETLGSAPRASPPCGASRDVPPRAGCWIFASFRVETTVACRHPPGPGMGLPPGRRVVLLISTGNWACTRPGRCTQSPG